MHNSEFRIGELNLLNSFVLCQFLGLKVGSTVQRNISGPISDTTSQGDTHDR